MDWIVCGRLIGTAKRWQTVDLNLTLFDLEGAEGYNGPVGDVLIRFENGTIESLNEDGTVRESSDLIEAIAALPVSRIDD